MNQTLSDPTFNGSLMEIKGFISYKPLKNQAFFGLFFENRIPGLTIFAHIFVK